ncbi:MAG: efflux RND transporter periplasmic adaptor subunit [Bacilli bacterium]
MKRLLNKKLVSMFVIIIFISLLILTNLFSAESNDNLNDLKKKYVVKKSDAIAFKGISDYYEKQDIFYNASNGVVSEVHVDSKQVVKKGDPLFTYYNDSLESEISTLGIQNDSLSNEYNINNDKLLNYKKQLDEMNQSREESLESITKKETLEANFDSLQTIVDTLSNNMKTNNLQINDLKSRLYKIIYADEEGIVYLNDDALTDTSIAYVSIIPNKSVIKSYVDEFDLINIQEGMQVSVNVLNSHEKMTGVVTKISEFPDSSKSNVQAYYEILIKQEVEYIRIGYSVNIELLFREISLRKDVVYEDQGKYFVNKKGENQIEITGDWKNGEFVVSSDNLHDGDILYEYN